MLQADNHMIVRTFIEENWSDFVFCCGQLGYGEEEAEAILKELGDGENG